MTNNPKLPKQQTKLDFYKSDFVVQNSREGDKWVCGTVREKLGPLLYAVETRDGGRWRRHVDQCRDSVNSPRHAEITVESAEWMSVCDTADNQNKSNIDD